MRNQEYCSILGAEVFTDLKLTAIKLALRRWMFIRNQSEGRCHARQAKAIKNINCRAGSKAARLCNRRVQSKSKDPEVVALSAMR